MKDRITGLFYILAVILLTTIHSIELYIGFFVLLSVLSGKDFIPVMKKTFVAVALFNGVITLAYILIKGFDYGYIALINLRVIDMTFMTFLFVRRVNLFRLFEFSSILTYLLVISYSQILLFKRYYTEFILALKSRSIKTPGLAERYGFLRSATGFFIEKSVKNSSEISLAMKSRGFFMD
ncbi:MAG: hypothetical protein GXO05_01890 [Aquificae bacterium]|nr:hypothetical protein [Aquificota bacterium]